MDFSFRFEEKQLTAALGQVWGEGNEFLLDALSVFSIRWYQEGARLEALIKSVLMAPLDSRYTQVGFNLVSVQVCIWQGSLTPKKA